MMTSFFRKMIPGAMLPLFFILAAPASSVAQEGPSKERTVKVQGQGKVRAVPDQVEMEFEVQEEGTQLADVSARVADKMKAVFQAVKSFGILDKDFKTVQYNIQPKFKYNNGESQRVGFIVSNRIRVVLKKTDQAGDLLEAVTKAGVSGIDGPTFGFSDPSKLQIEALKAAVEDAHAKALALAESAGAELGKVFSINQTGAAMPTPPRMFRAQLAGAADAGTVPIEKGENEVTAEVEVVYSLK